MVEDVDIEGERLGGLFWNIEDPVIVLRGDRVSAWNPSAEVTFGVAASEATAPGFDLRPIFGRDTETLLALMRSGGRSLIECEGGCEIHLEVTTWRVNPQDASPRVAVLRDVTAEHRYRASLERLNSLARDVLGEASFDVALQRIVDEAKELTRASFSALLLLREGTTTEVETFVFNAPRHLFPERLPRAVGLLAEAIRSGRPVRFEDIRGHPRGVGIPTAHPPIAALLAVPITVGERVLGEIAVAAPPRGKVFDDVDETVLRELSAHAAVAYGLWIARRAKAEADEAARTLLDVARHDIKTPVTVAKASLKLLRDRWALLDSESRARMMEGVDRSLDRVVRLANQLLIDERLQASSSIEANAIVEIRPLLRGLEDEVSPLARERGVTLAFEVLVDSPDSIPGSPSLVSHALENLITNAIKYSPPGERVTVSARREGDSVRIDVTDRGPGIPPENQPVLFERFGRRRTGSGEDVPGTGLGLSIVKRVADAHGGTVGVASRPEEGSTFWITFPLTRAGR